ncbi:hypothetical protein [Sandarakinorhabdus sp. AAP62]|uniref:hypothetical protein n=1 Tax=Sandarakinorhabdus sp. AAP62 TaxID=1248916 RepID=UPI000360E135|nr:hypothetical protein [Sandarakinorhabdus sp. AAP62]
MSWKIPVQDDGRETQEAMKRSKLSEAQIAFVLKQAEDGTGIGEVWQKAVTFQGSTSAKNRVSDHKPGAALPQTHGEWAVFGKSAARAPINGQP